MICARRRLASRALTESGQSERLMDTPLPNRWALESGRVYPVVGCRGPISRADPRRYVLATRSQSVQGQAPEVWSR